MLAGLKEGFAYQGGDREQVTTRWVFSSFVEEFSFLFYGKARHTFSNFPPLQKRLIIKINPAINMNILTNGF